MHMTALAGAVVLLICVAASIPRFWGMEYGVLYRLSFSRRREKSTHTAPPAPTLRFRPMATQDQQSTATVATLGLDKARKHLPRRMQRRDVRRSSFTGTSGRTRDRHKTNLRSGTRALKRRVC